MSFMGLGAFLSKFITNKLLDRFIEIELTIGLVGGISAGLLYASFTLSEYYYVVAFLLIAVISTLIGLEIPLITRILEKHTTLKDALANIMAVDYMGALIASILFPILLIPYLGIMRTAFIVGALNIVVGLITLKELKSFLTNAKRTIVGGLLSLIVLLFGFVYSLSITSFFENFAYQDRVIYAASSPYQRIVLTKFKNDLRLFLDGNVQFSSIDEHRYHESLVHIPLSVAANRSHILILGGGDGLAVREALKYKDVEKITLVDLDPAVVRLGKEQPELQALNQGALHDKRVHIVTEDAYRFLENVNDIYSAVLIDLPDPNHLSLGKLYTKEFYEIIKRRLAVGGVIATQSTSPYFARVPFWSIHNTLKSVFKTVVPYNVYVPSFGQWGFNLATNMKVDLANIKPRVQTRFLNKDTIARLFIFDVDTDEVEAEINKLNNQILVEYYEQSWVHYN
jgi:spermidine synthase